MGGIKKIMNKQNKTEMDSKIQRSNWWLPEGMDAQGDGRNR